MKYRLPAFPLGTTFHYFLTTEKFRRRQSPKRVASELS